MNEPIHIISLGAGVQSSTMSLMAACGEITPMPTAAIFADTGEEPDEVYIWLKKLEGLLPFPVHRVKRGQLSVAVFTRGMLKEAGPNHYVGLPTFKKEGCGQRHCTKYFKLLPIRKEARSLAGKRQVTMWIGISLDEAWRMKPSGLKWCVNTWPLIDKRLTRHDCIRWLESHQFQIPPKSACVFCPYNSDSAWRRFVGTRYWERICLIDEELQKRGEFLHRSCKPLSEVDFSTEEERGQLSMFNNECEGMCGV